MQSPSPIRILVVEDDADISGLLCELLTLHGYGPVAAYSGSEALLRCSQERFDQERFDLVLLDLMLPGKTGAQVLAELRAHSDLPVIIMTARADKATVVSLLSDGADDYVVKPFDNGELLARIAVQLRKKPRGASAENLLRFRDIELDLDAFDARIEGRSVGLSRTEFAILKLLMSHPRKVFTKNNLYESVWGGEFMGDDNTVNVHISKLRAKLAALHPGEEYVITVWGIGFKLGE